MHKIKIAAPTALHEAKGVFSFAKENTPFGTPRERLRLAVSDLNDSYASGMGMPARGGAALSVAIRFASAPTIRCCAAVGGSDALRMRHTPCGCRSAHLVEVRSNSRLPPVSTMRRAKQCRYFASSLPPSKRHSRLTTVRRGCCQVATRRDSWRSHVHRTYIAQRVQFFKLQTANVRGQGARPLAFSWGFKGDILSRERISPLSRAAPTALPSILLIVVPISPTKNKRLRAGHKTQHLPDDWLLEH